MTTPTSGLMQPHPAWTPDQLRQRFHALDAVRGKYPKGVVDTLMVDVLGALTSLADRVEKAELARDNALDDLRAYTAEHPDHVTVPLQAQTMLMNAQTECDQYIAATTEYCDALVRDARVEAEAIVAEARASADGLLRQAQREADTLRTEARQLAISDLAEPTPTGDAADDAEAEATWIEAGKAYLEDRRQQLADRLDEQIQRFQAARRRIDSPALAPVTDEPAG